MPNGKIFELCDDKKGDYLYHKSELGEFFLGSDAITHSYKNRKHVQDLTKQVPGEVDELFDMGSTIGGYIVFPNRKIDGKITINQARGMIRLIDDRFDLTLECIRRFYSGQTSPLFATLLRYKNFFDLFDDFHGYVEFFLLADLVDDKQSINFYLPFDNFRNPPIFSNIDEYLSYKNGVMNFINLRNKRIKKITQ